MLEQTKTRANANFSPDEEEQTGGAGGFSGVMSKKQMVKFAHRIGKRLLVDDTFLDDLADAMDGVDLNGELSETEDDDDEESESEEVVKKKHVFPPAKRLTDFHKQREPIDSKTVSDEDQEQSDDEPKSKGRRSKKRHVKFSKENSDEDEDPQDYEASE